MTTMYTLITVRKTTRPLMNMYADPELDYSIRHYKMDKTFHFELCSEVYIRCMKCNNSENKK